MDASFRRYSAFYFCYYAALGAYTPYIGRWVDSLGHGGYVVGGMLGIWYGSRILGPPAWAALIARSPRPGYWLVVGCALTFALFAGFTIARSTTELFVVMALLGLFYNAVMPQFEAMTLTALGADTNRYGRLRVWGSIGFLLVAGSYASVMDWLGDASFPWITLPWLLAMVAAAWPHRHSQPPARSEDVADAGHLWKRPGVRRFLLVALLVQVGFGGFYSYYTLHMQRAGHGGLAVGSLWALGVLIEIAMFWHSPKLIARHGAARLMSLCMLVTVARWTITALYAHSLPVMLLAQCTHALSFAVFHACCMRMMADYFPGRRAAAGQSLLYGFSSGVGGVLGAIIAAIAWENGGGRWAFLCGALATGLAWWIYLQRRPVIVED